MPHPSSLLGSPDGLRRSASVQSIGRVRINVPFNLTRASPEHRAERFFAEVINELNNAIADFQDRTESVIHEGHDKWTKSLDDWKTQAFNQLDDKIDKTMWRKTEKHFEDLKTEMHALRTEVERSRAEFRRDVEGNTNILKRVDSHLEATEAQMANTNTALKGWKKCLEPLKQMAEDTAPLKETLKEEYHKAQASLKSLRDSISSLETQLTSCHRTMESSTSSLEKLSKISSSVSDAEKTSQKYVEVGDMMQQLHSHIKGSPIHKFMDDLTESQKYTSEVNICLRQFHEQKDLVKSITEALRSSSFLVDFPGDVRKANDSLKKLGSLDIDLHEIKNGMQDVPRVLAHCQRVKESLDSIKDENVGRVRKQLEDLAKTLESTADMQGTIKDAKASLQRMSVIDVDLHDLKSGMQDIPRIMARCVQVKDSLDGIKEENVGKLRRHMDEVCRVIESADIRERVKEIEECTKSYVKTTNKSRPFFEDLDKRIKEVTDELGSIRKVTDQEVFARKKAQDELGQVVSTMDAVLKKLHVQTDSSDEAVRNLTKRSTEATRVFTEDMDKFRNSLESKRQEVYNDADAVTKQMKDLEDKVKSLDKFADTMKEFPENVDKVKKTLFGLGAGVVATLGPAVFTAFRVGAAPE